MSPTTIDLVLSSEPGEPAQVSAYNANTLILSCSGDASFFDSLKAELHTSTNLGTALADVTLDPIPAGDGPHDFEFSAAQMNRLPANFSGTRRVYCLVVRGIKGSGASVVKTTLWIARLTLLSAPAGDTPPPPPPSADYATQEELDALEARVDVLEDSPAGGTNLSTILAAAQVTVASNTGTDAVIPAATTTYAGVMSATQVQTLQSRAPADSPTFTGPVTLSDGGTLVLNDSASTFACIVSVGTLTANRTISLPNASGRFALTALENGAPDRVELYAKCDQSGGVTAGQAVYISGANGANKLIRKAQANGESSSSKTIGIVSSSLALNAFGYVVTEGDLSGLSISAPGAAENDPIWLSPTTAGGLLFGLANKPSAPNHMVFLGYVTRMTGSTITDIYVKVQNGFELEELHNVSAASPANGSVLFYRTASGLWESAVPAVGDISGLTEALAEKAGSSHTHAASDITSGTFAAARIGTGTATNAYVLTIVAGVPTWQAPAGGGAWGSITGTLSNQTDLQNALNAKANTSHTHTTADISGTFGSSYFAGTATAGFVLTIVSGVPTWQAPSGTGITDGTYGDIIVASSGTVWTVGNGAISYAKFQNVTAQAVLCRAASTNGTVGEIQLAASNLLGRGSTGNVAAISLGNGLGFSGAVLSVSFGTTGTTVCVGNDARLSDARTPTVHSASHQSGGADAIKLDDLAAPDDNTDLNATTLRHGLLPKLSGQTAEFLAGDGVYRVPLKTTRASNISVVLSMGSDEVLTAVDPGGDRLLFWNDTTNQWEYLSIGANLSISSGALNAAGGSGTGGDPILTFRASQLIPATTNGAGVDSLENTWNRDFLTFPVSANRFAELELGWPSGWTSYQYRVIWRSTATSGNTIFTSDARCFADSTSESAATGTAVNVTDSSSGTAQQVMVSDWSASVTPAGTVADGQPTQIRIGRLGLSETSPVLNQTVWVQMIQLRKGT